MPTARFQIGDTVMGRWPGSNLYYEVKVLSYDNKTRLYTVIYKDGTELELKESDITAGGRYNLRRRKDQGDGKTVELEQKTETETLLRTKPPTASAIKTTDLEFGGRVGESSQQFNVILDCVGIHSTNLMQYVGLNNFATNKKLKKSRISLQQSVFFLMFLLPVAVLALLILCGQKDASLQSFPLELPALESLWDCQVFGIVLLWLLFQAVLSLLPVGKLVEGMPLKNGKTLKYRINGFYALLLTAVAVGVAMYQEVDLSYIHAHFLQFYTSALLIVTLLSIYLFIRSRWASEDELAPGGNSGYIIYDFFMGRELNPRIKNLDIKFFCEMRPGLMGWVLINFVMLQAEMKHQNLENPSPAMLLVNIFQLLWVVDGFWHEEKLLTMMDIVYDGFGFMLTFGDLAFVPFTFTCQAYYLVSHPNELSAFWIITLIIMNGVGYYIFRKANSQKFAFRKNPSDPAVSHLKTIPTATGESLIVSGLWGWVRHPNYLGDIIMGLAWSLPCGFNHLIPYFYLIYLITLLVHRNARDEHQCRKKYGSAWDEYCKAVPFRIFPGIY
uniref:Delta(14)-sterol reductase LBR n=2 Tax=Cyprinus carpio TaxID=7962 RepID=A0A8C1BZT1_CYPCA